MAITYIGSNSLILQGDEQYQEFRSGLQRCVARFKCRNTYAATALGTLVVGYAHPVRTTLKLAEAPIQESSVNGFTEFVCTFYGFNALSGGQEVYGRNTVTAYDGGTEYKAAALTCTRTFCMTTASFNTGIYAGVPSESSDVVYQVSEGVSVTFTSKWEMAGFTTTQYGDVTEFSANFQSVPTST